MRLAIGSSDAGELAGKLKEWKAEPARFVREVFGATPDPWQDRVLEAFPSSRRLAMVACSNCGKTALESWLGWNFLSTRRHAQSKVTAISGHNLRDNLWKEMAHWHARSRLLQEYFEVGAQRITARGFEKTWFMAASTWDRDANPEQQGKVLAGLHAKNVLYILDEAGGIPSAVARTAENALADAECDEAHVVIAGNPLELSGPLYEAAVERPQLWKVFEVTGDPDDPNRAPRVSMQWAREMIDPPGPGREDAYVQVYVLGKFPTASTDALISLSQFEEAFARWDNPDGLARLPKALGVDVARHGKDRTVVFPRAGDLMGPLEVAGQPTWWAKQDTTYSTSRVVEIAEVWAGKDADPKTMPIYVDDIGVGGAVTDQLKDRGYHAIGINVESKAGESEKHANLKSEVCVRIQERFRRGNIAIHPSVKRRSTLVAEGSGLKVGFTAGRRRVEGKEEFQRRTGRSPDFWDAFMLAFAGEAGPVKRGSVMVGRSESSGFLGEEF